MRYPAYVVVVLLSFRLEVVGAEAIRLHPDNPHYFLFRSRPMALITSAEHYGAVLNADFDWRKYLDTLAADGMNYTRIFTGSYVEVPGAFGIKRNNLAPAAGGFLPPWARSETPGYKLGGNKFDLERWEPAYFERLTNFVSEAGKRGVVVEVTLFSSHYGSPQWEASPFHPENNVNGTNPVERQDLNTLGNGNILRHQERLVRKIVRELNGFDNVIYEIQNEPWSDRTVTVDHVNPYGRDRQFPNAVDLADDESLTWQQKVASWIASEEAGPANRHLIAQNVCNFRCAVRDLVDPSVSIVNFHYAYPEAATWNYGLGRMLAYDETGFLGTSDDAYRKQAWKFIMSGGGLFNHLDYSFIVGREDGTWTEPNGPGGGSPALRKQLKVLSDFIHSFTLPDLRLDFTTVRNSPGAVAQVLSARGREYAIHLSGKGPCTLTVDLPGGSYRAEWIDLLSGSVVASLDISHAGGTRDLASPGFTDGIAIRLRRFGS